MGNLKQENNPYYTGTSNFSLAFSLKQSNIIKNSSG